MSVERRPPTRRSPGFTLIEVLAAIFLTSVVIGIALSFFMSLSRSTDAATVRTRDGRRALAVLDRVARDLRGAYLLAKPDGLDPLEHPWLFLAESQHSDAGADRLKFVTRNHRPRSPLDHGSDIAMVSWVVSPSQNGNGYALLRAIEPGLPDALEREFLPDGDPSYRVVAEGLSHFAVRLMGDAGGYQGTWDSSLLEESGTLPRAAEIEIAYLPVGENEETIDLDDFDLDDEEAATYATRVLLPMRAIDLEAMLEQAEEDGEGANDDPNDPDDPDAFDDEEDAPTLGDRLSPEDADALVEEFGSEILNTPDGDPELCETLEGFGIPCS